MIVLSQYLIFSPLVTHSATLLLNMAKWSRPRGIGFDSYGYKFYSHRMLDGCILNLISSSEQWPNLIQDEYWWHVRDWRDAKSDG